MQNDLREHGDEDLRLAALRRYRILDTPHEREFDRLAELAAAVADAPVAFVNFVDAERTWSKARFGSDVVSVPRDFSPCSDAMHLDGGLHVGDALAHEKLRINPLVAGAPHFRAYVAVPLRSADRHPLGTVCALDFKKRDFSPECLKSLALIAEQVMELLEDRCTLLELLDAASEGVLICDRGWHVEAMNGEAARILSLSPEAARQPLEALLPAELLHALTRGLGERGVPPRSCGMHRIGTGRYRVCTHPTPRGFVIALHDATAELEVLEEERRSRTFLDALLSGSPDAIYAKDLNGRYLLANDVAARRAGRSRPEEVIGHTDTELSPPEVARVRMARDLTVIASGQILSFEEELPGSGETWMVSKGPLRSAAGEALGVFGISRDVTERKQAEQALKLSEERLRLAMDAGQLGAWDWDVERDRVSLTADAGAILSAAASAPVPLAELLDLVEPSDSDAVRAALEGARTTGELRIECRIRRPDGEVRWLRAVGRGSSDDGRVRRMVGALSDVTAEKERELQREEALRFQEKLLGMVSHDMRNPLTALRVWATTVSRDADRPEVRRAGERILHSGGRMERMIMELLDFTRARFGGGLRPAREPMDLREVCEHVVAELAAAHPGRFQLRAEGDLRGSWDPTLLSQVISNLTSNALHHGAPGEMISLSCHPEPRKVVLEVHNHGPAIPPELVPQLFEPFRRGSGSPRRPGSLGLGLFITSEAVRAHGGTISVRSSPSEGTTFRVELPRSDA